MRHLAIGVALALIIVCGGLYYLSIEDANLVLPF